MRKSLILGVVALLLAVGAAGTHRLRYDSSVFTGRGELTQTRPKVVRDYPPCVKGVREDRCIQLYERGMRRAYTRWRAEHGLPTATAERTYPRCRNRSDDRCQQRSARNRVRTARAATPQRTARRGQQQRTLARSRTAVVRRATPQRRTAQRHAAAARTQVARRAASQRRAAAPVRAATRAPSRATAPRPQPRAQPQRQNPSRQPALPDTPGI